jgi:hypothetical protein
MDRDRIQQAVVHHKRGKTIQFLHRTKEQLFSFSMILFLNRNDTLYRNDTLF